MKDRWKQILIILAGLLVIAAVSITYYFHRNLNYPQQMVAEIKRAGFVEKQIELPDGNVLNYGEGPDNGPALLLIHAQTADWTTYGRNLPELSKKFHVFAIDCYGHGKSSHNPEKYSANEMGEDFSWFIQNVIQEKVIVSGHSSGGLMAVWLGANAHDMVSRLVLEDPPLFSSEDQRKKMTYNYLDLSTISHQFLQHDEENDFSLYYFLNQRSWKFFPEKARGNLKKEGIRYRQKHPEKPLLIKYLPPTATITFINLDQYDPRFGESFYDGSFMTGFDHQESLERVKAPTILIHANWMEDEGVLNGAMTDEDANRVVESLAEGKLVKVDSGHGFHFEKPKQFNEIIFSAK
ncbi:pimeloyl-ACP methyl ester carboxylesterase [Sporosarcina luteola]|nr:pimeloyl-ACP methyl ester carboxylesterase [Sporosarcina luteola]